jgi:hypothetical protein
MRLSSVCGLHGDEAKHVGMDKTVEVIFAGLPDMLVNIIFQRLQQEAG